MQMHDSPPQSSKISKIDDQAVDDAVDHAQLLVHDLMRHQVQISKKEPVNDEHGAQGGVGGVADDFVGAPSRSLLE